ncbi:RENT2 protein, partial [Semnornis frantzii]|nr:RENT2 protein [Semnornis frantzii]
MPAERKKSTNMEEKDSLLNNKEKEFSERRPVSTREKPKEDVKIGMKRDTLKIPEDKKKKL